MTGMSYREPGSSLSANLFITRGAGGLELLGRVDNGLYNKHIYQSMTTDMKYLTLFHFVLL